MRREWFIKNSCELVGSSAASEARSGLKVAAGGAVAKPTTAGMSTPKSTGAARSAGTLEMHPVFAHGSEPACPGFGQHGCASV